jgi:PRTRC genetic system protein E
MNFFTQLIETGIKDVTIEIKVADDGRVTVLTSPKSFAKDQALNRMKPLLLTGTTDELDSGYFTAIAKPLKKTSEFFNNVENYEANLEISQKETAAAKLEKDKEKNAQADLLKAIGKLKTPADWAKNKDFIKKKIDLVFESNSENVAAKKAKKDLELNIEKTLLGDGLFADNENQESVDEIPTLVLEDDEEEILEDEEEAEEE